jgi:hypothetical protein
VQRQLFTTPDGIWISDDVLAKSLRRFASSVPGPMEARRRLGKRRITQQSQEQLTPASQFGGLWGFYPEVDRTKWQWEAPTRRQEKQEATAPVLPAWFSELENTLTEDVPEVVTNDATEEDFSQEKSEVENNIQNLRQEIRNATSYQHLQGPYLLYLSRLKQDLTLGLAPGEALGPILQDVTEDFRDVSSLWIESADGFIASFYASVWEGLTACQVLRPTDVDGEVINSLLSLLTSLSFTEKVQDLAKSILLSTSAEQHLKMEASIVNVVDIWTQSWFTQEYVKNWQSNFRVAKFAIVQASLSLDVLRGHISSLENSTETDGKLPRAHESLSCTKNKVLLAENAIANVEDGMWPRKFSAKKLAAALDALPSDLLSRIIPACSENIVKASLKYESGLMYYTKLSDGWVWTRESDRLPYRWLSTLSHMSKIGDQLFLHIWRELYFGKKDSFSEAGFCNLVLDHWVSQGLVTKSQEVGTLYAASTKQDFASLLFAIEKYRQNYWTRIIDVFLISDKLGRYRKVYQVLLRMRSRGMKLPWKTLRTAVEIISSYNNRLAIRTYTLGHFLDDKSRPISMKFLQAFVTTLIQDPRISPAQIWSMLDIPIYARLHPSQRGPRPERLSAGMEKLVNTMALEFALYRPKRIALRQIENSLHHLRVHKGFVRSELSRALSHVGITREIQDRQWIGQERLAYVLRMVEKIEGTTVAERVDRIVFDWRTYFRDKSAREYREENVLRVGPID